MRELKLRFWNNKVKSYTAGRYMIGDDGAIYDVSSGDAYEWHETNDVIAELPTGLKDKNGKEIYEGDIVEYSWDFCGEKRKNNYVVEWLSGKVEHYPYSVDSGFTLPDSVDGYMVVGNIHENPELIEKEKE